MHRPRPRDTWHLELVWRCVAVSSQVSIKVRLRITRGEDDAFGPGKAQLLESLLQTGSLNRSASVMKMSYVKALALVRAMNAHFLKPLVELSRGGKQGGGTQVTDAGRKVLAQYHAMREASESAALPGWRRLRRLVKA
jgi:molybdate transport system regulatory protein